jgi:hypothetical protein
MRVAKWAWCILLAGLLGGCQTAAPQPTTPQPATAVPTSDWSEPPGAELDFQRVTYNGFGYSDYYESRAAGLAVIASDGDRNIHERLIAPADAAAQAIDYDRFIMVIVFNGWRSSTGYGIRVDHVRSVPAGVAILATASEPAPDQTTGQAVTSPYEIIAIPRPAGMRGPVAFQLFLNGSDEVAFEFVKLIE